MVTQNRKYQVRKQLVLDLMAAFFTARWDGCVECEYMALDGSHNEGAVVNVHLDTCVSSFTRVPLISPSCDNKQIFVNHPQVSSFLRTQNTLFIIQQTDLYKLSEGQMSEFYPKVEFLCGLHLALTLDQVMNESINHQSTNQ